MKKLFIVTELFYPNKTSTAYIMTELAKHFASSFEVTVLCSDVSYDNNIASKGDDFPFIVKRVGSSISDKNNFFSRIIGAVGNSVKLIFNLFREVCKGDKVLAVTNPFLLVFFLAVLRSLKSFELVLLVHDIFPENTVPAGVMKSNSFSYKLVKNIKDTT